MAKVSNGNKVTGKIYIGETIQLQRREIEWRMYITKLNTDHSRKLLGEDVKKYGIDAFEMFILERVENATKELLKKRERFYVKLFKKVGEVYNHQWNSKWDAQEVKYGRREDI